MIPDLSSIIEHSTCWCFSHNLFERKSLELGSYDELVQVIDIGLVMFAVVKFEGFSGDMWRESIEYVWESREREHSD